jgi:hypothetical protein
MENYLYFAESSVITGGGFASGGSNEAVMVPASSYLYADPSGNTTTDFFFKNLEETDYGMCRIRLTHDGGENKEVIKAVLSCMNASPSEGGFIVVADMNTINASNPGPVITGALVPHNITNCTITQDVSGSFGALTYGYQLPEMTWGGAATAIAAGALTVNTNYTNNETAAKAYTIPSCAAGKVGDWITVTYIDNIADGQLHSYHSTSDTQFVLGSRITSDPHDGTRVGFVDLSVADDDEVKITGETNGDGGIGTTLKFLNTTGQANGWVCEVIVKGQGTCAVASNAATHFAQ